MPTSDKSPDEGFEKALENLDFDGARRLADRAADTDKDRLGERIQARYEEAADRAEKLAARIQFLARADHYEGLLALAADPTTEPLLALLPTELRRGAMLHLDGATRRQRRFRVAAQRHMKAAADALIFLDTTRALNEIEKVETRWLTEAQREKLETLRTQTENAVAERQELEDRTAAVLREHLPDPAPEPARATRTSRIRRGGCFGSALVLVLAMVVMAALLNT